MFIFNEILFHLKWEKARNKWIKNKKKPKDLSYVLFYIIASRTFKKYYRETFSIFYEILSGIITLCTLFVFFFQIWNGLRVGKLSFSFFSHFVMVTRGKSRKNEKFCNNSQFSDNWKVPTGLKSFWFIRKMVFCLFLCS